MSLPAPSPTRTLGLVLLSNLAGAAAALWLALATPWLGLGLVGDDRGVVVATAAGPAAQVPVGVVLSSVAAVPGGSATTPTQPACVVVVASIFDDDNLFQALPAGARGYLLKDHPGDWLSRQLTGIADGQPPLSPAIARRLLRHFHGVGTSDGLAEATDLSPREREVPTLLAKGIRIAEIAAGLAISRHTEGDHVKNIYRKLNISSRAEAALRARSLGLV